MYFINFNSNHVLNDFLILLEPKHAPVSTHLPMCLPDFPLLTRPMDKNFIAVIYLLKESYSSTSIPQSMGQHQDLIGVTAARRIWGLYNKLSMPKPFLKRLISISAANADCRIVDLINCQKNSTFKHVVISD